MANGEDKSKRKDFYQVLGLNKECTATELRNAYKKLALRWHPDRCSASGNSKFVEEAKQNFQAIQEAYSVLSDTSQRFLYDVGAYDNDDEENGMGNFLSEMTITMSQIKHNKNGEESFEDLQELFEQMFQEDIESFGGSCQAATAATASATTTATATATATMYSSTSSSYASYSESSSCNDKRYFSEMNFGEFKVEDSLGLGSHFQKFCLGVEHQQDFKKGKGARGGIQGGVGGSSRRRNARKQKVSSGLDMSSQESRYFCFMNPLKNCTNSLLA
ncbi:hypothetical protein P3X46_011233 [Hevea brasiliensis]|uniref:J domain-containing protein n=1 Tax=Hevea brasiliensis TaxID=3981 RepID=A0ABQ9MIJ3_HEVBR|nr:hypothetical protein P3X46_011233 [Hevea brasiliensis]